MKHQLIDQLQHADDSCRSTFTRLINESILHLNLSDKEVGEMFDISRISVRRWTEGRNVPTRSVRSAIYRCLIEEIKND